MMRLQGMLPSEFNLVTSEAVLGKQLGNTMSVNVIERILVSLLPAAGFTNQGKIVDRWLNGTAIRGIKLDKDRSFQNHMLLAWRRGCLRMITGGEEKEDEHDAADT